jgi:hypothetical protein
MIKKPNLIIHEVEEGAKVHTKVTDNLFNEIVTENFPYLGKDQPSQQKP